MKTKRWTSDCGNRWYEMREDGSFHSYLGNELKYYKNKNCKYVSFNLTIKGKYKHFYLPVKSTMLKYFVDNPNGYKYMKFIDDNEDNFSPDNLQPTEKLFDSLTTESQERILRGRREAKESRLRAIAELKAEKKKNMAEKVEQARVKKIIKTLKTDSNSTIERRDARTKEKYLGFKPRVGLFGRRLPSEEPKYDHNFKLIEK